MTSSLSGEQLMNNAKEMQLGLSAPYASIPLQRHFLAAAAAAATGAVQAQMQAAPRQLGLTGAEQVQPGQMLHVRQQRQTSRVSSDARKVEMKTGAHSS